MSNNNSGKGFSDMQRMAELKAAMEKVKEVWIMKKPCIFKYRAYCISGCGVFFMFIIVLFSKGIDAYFISAVMDTIMAGATVAAVITARNYLAQFTAQEGYKVAIGLVNDVIPEIKKSLLAAKQHFECVHNMLKEVETNRDLQRANYSTCVIGDVMNKLRGSSDSIRSHVEKVKTYGLIMEAQRFVHLESLLKDLDNMHKSYGEYSDELTKYIEAKSREDITAQFSSTSIGGGRERQPVQIDKSAKDSLSILHETDVKLKNFEKMIFDLDKVVGEPKVITKIFEI